ncbi:MAG: isochorismatase family protein [Paracoccaceae bacterium]
MTQDTAEDTEDDTEVYARQKFGQTIAPGTRPALILVDFVNGFLDPNSFGGGNCVSAAEATVPVLAAARAVGIPIVFTRIVYASDGSDGGIWWEKAPRLAELTEEAEPSQVADILAPRAGEIIIRKKQASAFCGTDLAATLRARGVDTLVITGLTTSGCVRATTVDALSLNFRPFVVPDCCGDRALGPHDANLFDMGQKYANLVSVGAALALMN